MNLYLHELKSNRKSIITWAIALSALIILFMTLYPAFTQDVASTKKILEGLPPAFRAAMSISLETFFSIFGFYIYILSFVILAGAIFAMNLGITSLSKEEHDKTADFLLSKPITRNQVITAKILANLSAILIVDLCFFTGAIISAKMASPDPFSTKTFLLITLILFFVQLVFLFLGTVFSVSLPKIKSAISISLPVVFIFYIINALGSVLGDKVVRYITPFKFYDPLYVAAHDSYELKYYILELIIILVFIGLTYVIYNKKDIQSAT